MQARSPDERPSREGPSASTVGGPPSTENIVIGERYNPRFLRAISRKYKIESTRSLVVAYNATTDRDELAVLLGWLNQYGERRDVCLRPRTVLEYAELASIKSRSAHDDDILKDLVHALYSCICQENFGKPNFASALRKALESADPSVYGGVAQLVVVAQRLLSSLSSELRVTEENFEEHEATFLALRQTFLLLSETSQSVYEKEKFELRRAVAEKKIAMNLSCKYYPVSFHFDILQQALKRIKTKDPYSRFARAMQHVGCGLRIVQHILMCFRSLARIDIDLEVVEDTYREAQVVINMAVSKKPWFDTLKNLITARREASKDEVKLELFETNYSAAMEHQRNTTSGKDLKALRFGIIRELGILALEGVSKNTQNAATAKLVELATHQAITEEWTRDIDILIELLDVTCELHGIGQCNEDAKNALIVLHQSSKSFAEEALTEWLGGSSLEDKLQARSLQRDIVQHEDLCVKIGRNVGYIPLAIIAANKEDLRRTYLQDDFAMVLFSFKNHLTTDSVSFLKVASLFAERPGKHVKDMKHHVVISEETIEKRGIKSKDGLEGVIRRVEEGEGESLNRTRDHAKEYDEQKIRVTKPIALDDLFRQRSLKSGDPESEVRRVLIYGNPGSGKTCITKVIAHRWALGEAAQEFNAVYVVPVEVLNSAWYEGEQRTRLEGVIAQTCFSGARDTDEYDDLVTQIGDDLDDPSTLLMLDGLDEANDDANELVSTAWGCSCKVLFLSRPYNTRNIETRVDIQVECLGFSDEQLRDYVRSELSEVPRLIRSLENATAMWEMAHIPAMAHILCSLSKKHGDMIEEGKRTSTFQIYNDMVTYVWKRFRARSNARNIQKLELLRDLEKIAFESLRRGSILIDRRLVMACTTSNNAAKIFTESGLLLLTLEGQEYQFPHLTFQEYFAGRYIARILKQKGSDEKMEVLDFIHGGKYDAKHDLTLTFAMHAFAEGRSKLALEELLSIMNEQPGEVLEMHHVFLRMRALEATIEETYNPKDLKTLVSGEEAIEIAEDARRLLERTIDSVPAGQIVLEKFEQCYCVLDRFPQILSKTIEEVKRLLTSTRDLSEVDGIKIRRALMLATQSPKHINGVIGFFLEEMNRVQDRFSSHESLRRFELIAEVAPQYAGDMLLMLGRWKADDNFGMRKRAKEILKNVIGEAPHYASSMLPMLKKAFSDENVIMRMEATKAIESVVEAAPHLAGDMLAMLEKACADEESGVRRRALEAIGSVVKAAPQLASDVLPMLEKSCADENAYVRERVMEAVRSVVGAAPLIASDVLPMLERGCRDEVIYVRERALKAVRNVVGAAPHVAGDMLTMLKTEASDEDVVVRKATKAIESVVEAAPRSASDILSMQRDCGDETLHFPLADKLIHSIIALIPEYKRGLLFLFVRHPLLFMLLFKSEEVFLFLHSVSLEEIKEWEKESFTTVSGI